MRNNPRAGQPEEMLLVAGFEVGTGSMGAGKPPAYMTLRLLRSDGSPIPCVALPFGVARDLARALADVAEEAGCPIDPSTN